MIKFNCCDPQSSKCLVYHGSPVNNNRHLCVSQLALVKNQYWLTECISISPQTVNKNNMCIAKVTVARDSYLASDSTYNFGIRIFGDKEMAQSHGAEKSIGACQWHVFTHHERRSMHEWTKIYACLHNA